MQEPDSMGDRLRTCARRAEEFVKHGLWQALPDHMGLRFVYRLLRMGVLTVEGFSKSEGFLLSAALTYQVTFALVPLLVVMLAVVKGVGGFAKAGGQVQEFLLKNITPQVGDDLVGRIDTFISNVNATAIGVVGFALLLYTSLSLLQTIEKAFNKIWGVQTSRALLRRFTVYWTLLTVTPLLLAASLAMTTFVRSHFLYLWLTENVPYFGKVTLIFAPFAFAWILFTGFYMFMPNTRVHPGAALIGALVAGTTWEAMKTLYFWYNTKIVTAYAFYGSLGSIPIFLLWIYLSWNIVLFGAEVAFAAQHMGTYKREVERVRLRTSDRDRLALVISVEAVKPFQRGDPPPTGEEIAGRMNTPVRVVNELLFQLAAQGILREVALPDHKDPGFLPARDPGVLTAGDVLLAVRTYGDDCPLPAGAASINRLLDQAEAQAMGSLAGVTLRELAR